MPGDKVPQASVKTELPYKRLPSFRTPRDLKLSEFREVRTNPLSETRTKRVFVPNLNIQRKKNDEKDAAQKSDTNSKEPEKKEERFRPRVKKTKELIQSSGVFSEGLAPTVKSSGWKSKNTDATPTTSMPRPKLKSLDSFKVNKEENDELMKELLRDDFINDPELEPDASYAPIQLPLQKCTINDEKPIPNINGIKNEPEQDSEEYKLFTNCETKPVDINYMRPFSMADVLSIDKQFMFFQLPTCLPQLQLNLTQMPKKNNTTEDNDSCLKSLPQGQIGKLQQLRSGKIRLLLGGVKMDIEPGIQPTFKQDLISANLNDDTKTGNLVNLGSITTKMLVTPNWETVIKS